MHLCERQPMTDAAIAARVEAMGSACRAGGMKVTQQRRVILEALLRAGEHLSAEAVHERVRPEFPALSLSTVYSTLETLADVGVIGTVDGLDGPRLFDPEPSPHHHFVCRDTGRVLDIDDTGGAIVSRAALKKRGIEVEDVRLIVYGRMKA